MRDEEKIDAARVFIVVFGIISPYLSRLILVPKHGLEWLWQIASAGIGGHLFIGFFNAFNWFIIFIATLTIKHSKPVWFMTIFSFLIPVLGYSAIDLNSDAQASIGLIFIPLYSIPITLIIWLSCYIWDRYLKKRASSCAKTAD